MTEYRFVSTPNDIVIFYRGSDAIENCKLEDMHQLAAEWINNPAIIDDTRFDEPYGQKTFIIQRLDQSAC